MDTEAKIILDDTISFCERDGRDARLIQILKQSEALELTDTDLSVEVPTRFAYSYLVKQRDVVERYLEDIAFTPLALNITVSQAITAPQEHTAAAGATTGSAPEERPRIPTVDWDAPAPESRDRVKVKNIISPDALRELTASVQQHEPATTVEPGERRGRTFRADQLEIHLRELRLRRREQARLPILGALCSHGGRARHLHIAVHLWKIRPRQDAPLARH